MLISLMNNLGVLKSRNGQFSLFKIVFLEIELSSNVSKSSSETLEKRENLLTWLNVKTGLHVLLLFLYIVKACVRCCHNYFFSTVFGNTGLHLILRGSVMSESLQAISPVNIDQDRRDFSSPSPILEEDKLQTIKEKVCGLLVIYFL